MASVHSKELHIYNARQVRESFSEAASSNVYLTFGKCTPWANDSSPEVANTAVVSFYDVWNNMIGGKRLLTNQARHGIPRHDWTANTVYCAYDDRLDSLVLKDANSKFFVVATDSIGNYNIFKCLANNNGSNSTVKPTSTITSTSYQTSDGYIWKYMYTLTDDELMRFTTDSYIPVKTLTLEDSSLQSLVQTSAVDGSIEVIKVDDGGQGYQSNNISVVIIGDGFYANAFAIRNTSTNTISSIVVDNKGYGYTYANVIINSDSGSNASARIITSPPGGHGSDPLSELGGSFLILNVQLKNSELGVLTVANDYRQVCLLEDPKVYGTTNTADSLAFSQLTKLTLSGTSAEYYLDEVVYQGTAESNAVFKAIVTEWDSTNNTIMVSNVTGSAISDPLIGANSGASRFVSSVTNPELQKYSGKLLYIDNITPVSRASDQTEDYKIILSF